MKKYIKNPTFVFILLYILTALFLIWRAHQGIGSSDEYFYITEGLRSVKGDRLFVDDWHIAQLMTVFLGPLVKLSSVISPDYEGIVLQFRIYYIVFTMIIGLLIFLRFRKNYGIRAVYASLIYILFTPFQIMALSYNTMGPGFVILALLVYPKNRNNKGRIFLFGVFMALAVMNMPYLIFLYLFLIILVIIKHKSFSGKELLFTSLGAISVAMIFIVCLLSKVSIQELTVSLPHLIDPSHSDSLIMKILKNGYRTIQAYHVFLLVYIIEIILGIRYHLKKSTYNPIRLSIILNSISMLFLSFVTKYQPDFGGFAIILLPFAITGFIVLLTESSDNYLISCYIVSVFLSVMVSLSSNVGPSSFICPLIIASCVTALLLKEPVPYSSLFILLFIGLLVFFKVTVDFGSDTINNTVSVDKGPLKGLKGSDTEVKGYLESLEDFEYIKSLPEKNASLITYSNWGYFIVDKTIAANSTYLYFWDRDSYVNAEDQYYELHTERYPAYVYVDEANGYFIENDPWISSFEKVKELNKGILYIRK